MDLTDAFPNAKIRWIVELPYYRGRELPAYAERKTLLETDQMTLAQFAETLPEGYAVLGATILSRNGAYGGATIYKWEGGFCLEAGGNDTGRSWKSPEEVFATIEAAVNNADKLWISTRKE